MSRGNNNFNRNFAAGRRDVAAVQAGCRDKATQMSVMNWIGLALALGLGVYLVAALLFPEKFE
jgi:K+-transporting ATPase KdpF subunit